MSKILCIMIIFLQFYLVMNDNDIINDKDVQNDKKKIEWTTTELIKYTLEHHDKDKYFICDPLNYISEDEKEVIYYRLEGIYNKLNITTVFFVLDKISLQGLNITKLKHSKYEEDDDDEEDDIVYDKSKVNITNNITLNKTLVKTEQERQQEFKAYINEVKSKIFNRKIFSDRESKSLVGIFTVDDLGKYIYVGKDNQEMITETDINYLLDGKDYLIQKGNLYLAVDNFFSNFLYRFAPGKMDKINKFIGYLGELLGFGAIIFSYYIMNRKKDDRPEPPSTNKKEDKSDEKKEKEKKDEEKPKKD